MKYLLYLQDGFIKKFPLISERIILGRDPGCDLCIDKEFISKRHAQIKKLKDEVEIIDLDSKNGIYFENFKVDSVRIKLNESFNIGYMDFVLKEGNTSEFKISKEAKSILKRITKSTDQDTKRNLNMFDKSLLYMLELGFKIDNINQIFEKAKIPLLSTLKQGIIILIKKTDDSYQVTSEVQLEGIVDYNFEEILEVTQLFEKDNYNLKIFDGITFYSFPLNLSGKKGVLVYLYKSNSRMEKKKIKFLQDFSKEISLIFEIIEENKSPIEVDPNYQIVTINEGMIRLMERCKRIAKSDISILIEGETGTGKELFARFIHKHSDCDISKYIGINCSAIPENLLEDELFGHEKGAFTGASDLKKGKLEIASGGTLVLDEIGDMPIGLQAKLLRVLQEKEFYRVGGSHTIKVNLRLISLSNKNIHKMVEEKQFREDLFYRIAHFIIEVPPLRDRPDDIIPLLNHFIAKFSKQNVKYIKGFTESAIEFLKNHSWPGNIRQLENFTKILINIANPGETISALLLKNEISFLFNNKTDPMDEERNRILKVLEKNLWNKSLAAKELKISRAGLYKKMKKLNIKY